MYQTHVLRGLQTCPEVLWTAFVELFGCGFFMSTLNYPSSHPYLAGISTLIEQRNTE